MLILSGPVNVISLAFAPDNATLFAENSNPDSGVRVWNLADRSERRFEFGGEPVYGPFTLHPGGRWAFGRTDRITAHTAPPVRAFDLSTGTAVPFLMSTWPGRPIGVSADGVATAGNTVYDQDRPRTSAPNRLYNWALTGAGPECAWYRDVPANRIVWLIACVCGDRIVTLEATHSAPRWEPLVAVRAATGEPEVTFVAPTFTPQQFLASPDGRQFVYRLGTELRVWDATDWRKPPTVVAGKHKHTMHSMAAAFHPSGRYLLLGNDGPSVLVFDTSTWKEVRKWKWSVGALRTVAVSADGSLAAAAGPRGTIVVWDLDL